MTNLGVTVCRYSGTEAAGDSSSSDISWHSLTAGRNDAYRSAGREKHNLASHVSETRVIAACAKNQKGGSVIESFHWVHYRDRITGIMQEARSDLRPKREGKRCR